jgi:serine/threonine protein kinase
VEELVVEFLDRSEVEGLAVLEELCSREPARAAQLRSRVSALERAGLLAPKPLDAPPEHLGDFRVLERVGGGGMGVVYRAVQESLGRVVALKVLRAEHLWFAGARERFRREAEAIAQLAHPSIVPLYSFGEADGVPYLAMEFVRGASLSAIVAMFRGREPASLEGADLRRALTACLGAGPGPRGDPLRLYDGSWSDACARIGAVVAGALEHAHERGVLHRDLKPSNVMLAEDGRVLLVDFGLAAREGADRLTRTGSQLGSLPYMAPEQVDGRTHEVGARTDVYGLAVTLYELLTLRLPFDTASAHEILLRVTTGDAAPVRAGNARISRDLETVIATAMDVRADRRYASAADFARDLRNVVERRPIAARRSGPVRHAWRWMQRHPATAAALALAALVFVGGPIVFAVQQNRALKDLAVEAGRTARANIALEAALARAESNFTQALEAVGLLTRVGEERLADVPAAEEARRELLEGALAFHSRLAEQRRGDPAFAGELARTELRVGEILAALGRHDEAELVFASVEQVAVATPAVLDEVTESFLAPTAALSRARSLEWLGRIDEARPIYTDVIERLSRHEVTGGPVEARELLLTAWTRLQTMRQSAGDAAGSREAHETRSRICDKLYREFPAVHRYGVEVAECYLALALEHSGYVILGVESDRERQNRLNVLAFVDPLIASLRQASSAKSASESETSTLLARSLVIRAQMLSDLREFEASISAWSEAIAIHRESVARHPGVPRHARALAQSLATMGAVLSANQDHAGALATYAEVIHLRETSIGITPADTKQRAGTGIVRLNMGLVLQKVGRTEESLEVLARALEDFRAHLAREPKDPFILARVQQTVYVRSLELLDLRRGEEAHEQLEEQTDVEPSMRVLYGRQWARAADQLAGPEAATCRERALALLETAIGGPNAPGLLDSPEFDSLRDDPRFVEADRRLRP